MRRPFPPAGDDSSAADDVRAPRTPALGTPAAEPLPGTPPPGSLPSPDAVPGAPAVAPARVGASAVPVTGTHREPPPTTASISLHGLPGRRQPDVPSPPVSGGRDANPEWYRTAVFYEVMLRTFADSSGNGSGDLPGLIQRLDYLQWLGVDCLWLPPFYPSPLRDGGYDVSDYTAVAPQYGTLDDFRTLVTECHRRGMRIVVDLVMNHTSDQHPWFQASRSDPDGPYGDFYVWSDDNTRYQDARIIFVDTETSNWTFDPVRRQYFWHRFFSHQPDLNFENPRVVDAMLDVARFWLHLGVDGFRLDAVPYLFEAEGTNCENLPETHEFLRKVRRVIDDEFPGRIMLAEANQWPEDVVHYFGTDDEPECHMCFHFPVMPRIYYALRDQRATQIVDILADTPPIPASGQWSTFLRNHDELTLEMVSTEERASMYGWYAPDSRMRANVGIRRRLAPLLDNSRKEIELAHALLLSLPGSPCLYYGDEIGMGDNIWLSDRDAVRTPMQWTPDRNAGFSTADPGKLYLPLVQSLVYHYGNVNVESQLAQPTSLLHWVHGMLAVRRQHPALGLGEFEVVPCDNESVLTFLRRTADETILVVANLAATARAATITLSGRAGWATHDVFGGAHFPDVRQDGTMTFTLGSREFYWLELTGP
ncbi:maltose alpha-D-glucosyltransferase [Cellulomonas xiejunii]|uniref:Alpha-amylase n=1 Tax=Cellulomonas xiejunii TaxID=2968083 RepID=A0ABY5KT73_9CELL|nr:maltose alpha-D-glucosyltransferase [Cellulomonas xiejunii]MCC2321608.1 maltose alpha-D-glucosyltransferase [Cellulomonas xiejunii]UUI72924.1 maltose alpha-D-glucosyltransferase [Cellulomonas xiejunii]